MGEPENQRGCGVRWGGDGVVSPGVLAQEQRVEWDRMWGPKARALGLRVALGCRQVLALLCLC